MLTGSSADARRFLTRTSVLTQLSGTLCDAVLQRDGLARPAARARAANLLVIALPTVPAGTATTPSCATISLAELDARSPRDRDRAAAACAGVVARARPRRGRGRVRPGRRRLGRAGRVDRGSPLPPPAHRAQRDARALDGGDPARGRWPDTRGPASAAALASARRRRGRRPRSGACSGWRTRGRASRLRRSSARRSLRAHYRTITSARRSRPPRPPSRSRRAVGAARHRRSRCSRSRGCSPATTTRAAVVARAALAHPDAGERPYGYIAQRPPRDPRRARRAAHRRPRARRPRAGGDARVELTGRPAGAPADARRRRHRGPGGPARPRRAGRRAGRARADRGRRCGRRGRCSSSRAIELRRGHLAAAAALAGARRRAAGHAPATRAGCPRWPPSCAAALDAPRHGAAGRAAVAGRARGPAAARRSCTRRARSRRRSTCPSTRSSRTSARSIASSASARARRRSRARSRSACSTSPPT